MPIQIGLHLSPVIRVEGIVEGRKTLIVLAEESRQYIRIPIYLLSDSKCYAKIVLSEPEEITLEGFQTLYEKHLISDKARECVWPEIEKLYIYTFQILEKYHPPKRIGISTRSQGEWEFWARKWEWLGSSPKEFEVKESPSSLDKVELVPFVVIPDYTSHTGSGVYNRREPRDADLVFRTSIEDPRVIAAILRTLAPMEIEMIFDERGPAFDYCPLLDLVAVPVDWGDKGLVESVQTKPEGISEHSWEIYRKFPQETQIDGKFIFSVIPESYGIKPKQSGICLLVCLPRRHTGVEIKLERLFSRGGFESCDFVWDSRGPLDESQAKLLFRVSLVPHIPLELREIHEPWFKSYYEKE